MDESKLPLNWLQGITGGASGGGGESEAAAYGRLHEKEARRKLEQILGLQIAEAKKVVDKGRGWWKDFFTSVCVFSNDSWQWSRCE